MINMGSKSIAGPYIHRDLEQWQLATWTTEFLLGCGAVVLSVLGIFGLFRTGFAAGAIILLGAMLLFQGLSVAIVYSQRQFGAQIVDRFCVADLSRGLAVEFLAATAGIALGILALLQIVPNMLMSAAVVTYGGALLLTSGEPAWLIFSMNADDKVNNSRRAACFISVGTQALVGAASLVLGILALGGTTPLLMVLIALLASGASIVLRSSLVGKYLGNPLSS
jgi:hypothetical protein